MTVFVQKTRPTRLSFDEWHAIRGNCPEGGLGGGSSCHTHHNPNGLGSSPDWISTPRPPSIPIGSWRWFGFGSVYPRHENKTCREVYGEEVQ